jgi:hypothetical protein
LIVEGLVNPYKYKAFFSVTLIRQKMITGKNKNFGDVLKLVMNRINITFIQFVGLLPGSALSSKRGKRLLRFAGSLIMGNTYCTSQRNNRRTFHGPDR